MAEAAGALPDLSGSVTRLTRAACSIRIRFDIKDDVVRMGSVPLTPPTLWS
jgi:hypothetical protein